jgi:hypothetical protein
MENSAGIQKSCFLSSGCYLAGWVEQLPSRHIGDFTRRKEHDAYSKALARLLRDLKVEKG